MINGDHFEAESYLNRFPYELQKKLDYSKAITKSIQSSQINLLRDLINIVTTYAKPEYCIRFECDGMSKYICIRQHNLKRVCDFANYVEIVRKRGYCPEISMSFASVTTLEDLQTTNSQEKKFSIVVDDLCDTDLQILDVFF